jgi:hypothetical protein
MIQPSPEQFGLTESLVVSLEKERGDFKALKSRRDRWVTLAIAAGAISAIAFYTGYGFDWPLFIPTLLICAVFMGYFSPMVTAAIVNRLDPHSRLHEQYGNYWVECVTYRAFWRSAYWDAFWKALGEGGNCVAWKDHLPESPHSRLKDLPDPGEELFLMTGERSVLVTPRPTEPVNREFADRLLKTVQISSAQKGIICSDEAIPQEVRDVLKTKNIVILPSRLFLITRVLRRTILQVSLPILERATKPIASLLNQNFAKFRESELPFPPSMIRQAIAEELQECHDETLQTALGKLYVILENFLPDDQGVHYDKLREFQEHTFQEFRGMQEEGKPPLEILKTLIPLIQHLEEAAQKIDPTIDTNMLEKMKKRSEELEAFKEIAARNVNSENR